MIECLSVQLNSGPFYTSSSVASNAIQTIDNQTAYLIIYCLNCIRRDVNSTYKTGLKVKRTNLLWMYLVY